MLGYDAYAVAATIAAQRAAAPRARRLRAAAVSSVHRSLRRGSTR